MSSQQSDVQLYMCEAQRNYVSKLTMVYIDFARSRLIFNDDYIREQASIAETEAREKLISNYSDEDDYMNVAENAFERGFEVYSDLKFLKTQSVGLALIGLFHLWEKLIKRFISAELRKDGAKAEKPASKWTFDDICDMLTEFGFDVRAQIFYAHLNQLRLVANSVKHGHGKSREELAAAMPNVCSYGDWDFVTLAGLERDEPQLEECHFHDLTKCVVDFWQQLPERLFYIGTP